MKNIDFPIFKTKIVGESKDFDLNDINQRREYFEHKAHDEIRRLKEYLENNTFIVYLLSKKNSGKGTYSKMLKEIVGDKIQHLSVGDMIRSFDEILQDEAKKQELIDFLRKKYRGPVSVEEIIASMESRSTKILLPTELILALTEREISKLGKKAIFIDGFPRDFDQVSYSLFFKSLIDYRNDPDIFVLIDVPTNIIDKRAKYRLICPICQTSRSLRLLPTKNIEYDQKEKKFHLICDNPECQSVKTGEKVKMVTKEGDELGIEPIRERLEKEENLMEKIYHMHGISKIFLRNSIPLKDVEENYNDYEITQEYDYEYDEKNDKVLIKKKPWEIEDDNNVMSNSLMPPPVVVSLIKQLVRELGI